MRNGQAARADIFLSYNGLDEAFVTLVDGALRHRHVAVFFAPESIRSGDEFLSRLEKALLSASTFVYFVGQEEGYWQRQELQIILHEARTRDVRIIPVLLPGVASEMIPPVLRSRTWIDCRALESLKTPEEIRTAPSFLSLTASICNEPALPSVPLPGPAAWIDRHLPLLRAIGVPANVALAGCCAHAIVWPHVPPSEAVRLAFTNYWVLAPLAIILIGVYYVWRLDTSGRPLAKGLLVDTSRVLRKRAAVYALGAGLVVLSVVFVLTPPFVTVTTAEGRIDRLDRDYVCDSRASSNMSTIRIQGSTGSRDRCRKSGLEGERFEARFYTGWASQDRLSIDITAERPASVRVPQVEIVDAAIAKVLGTETLLLPRDTGFHTVRLDLRRSDSRRRFTFYFAGQYDLKTHVGKEFPFVIHVSVKAGEHERTRSFPFHTSW